MSKRPQVSIREKQEERVLRKAHERKEKRDEATFTILKDQADKTDKSRTDEESHKKIERHIWLKQIAVAKIQIKTAKQLNRVTLVAAIFALLGVGAVVWSIRDARDATIAANRAWLAPEVMALNNPVESGHIIVHLLIQDTGREPGTGMKHNLLFYTVPYIQEGSAGRNGYSALDTPNRACIGLERGDEAGGVVYPGDTKFWIIEGEDDIREKKNVLDILARHKTLVVDGCVKYLTFGKPHTSSFRFFLRDVPGPSCPDAPKGECSWRFNLVENGANAD